MIGTGRRRYSDWESGGPVPSRLQLLRDLIGGRLPRHKIDTTLAWMQGNGYVEAQSDGRIALSVGRHVIIRQARAPAIVNDDGDGHSVA